MGWNVNKVVKQMEHRAEAGSATYDSIAMLIQRENDAGRVPVLLPMRLPLFFMLLRLGVKFKVQEGAA